MHHVAIILTAQRDPEEAVTHYNEGLSLTVDGCLYRSKTEENKIQPVPVTQPAE